MGSVTGLSCEWQRMGTVTGKPKVDLSEAVVRFSQAELSLEKPT